MYRLNELLRIATSLCCYRGLDDSSNHSLPQPQHGSADGTRLRVRNKQPSPTNRSKKTKDGRVSGGWLIKRTGAVTVARPGIVEIEISTE